MANLSRETQTYTKKLEKLSAKQNALRAGQKRRREAFKTLGFGDDGLVNRANAAIAGQNAMAVGSGIINFFKAPLNAAVSLADQMAAVSAATGATGLTLSKMQKRAEQLGKTTTFSALEVAKAQEILGQAGVSAKELSSNNAKGILAETLTVAQAGDISIAESADILTSVRSQYSLTGAELAKVGGLLAKVSTDTKTDFGFLGATFGQVGTIAASQGVKINELAAHIKVVADRGLKGAEAGTALKNAYLRLSGASATSKKALEEQGIRVSDSSGRMRSLNEIVSDLAAATEKMTEEQRQSYITNLAGAEALPAVLALMGAANEQTTKTVKGNKQLSNALLDLSDAYHINNSAVADAAKKMQQARLSSPLATFKMLKSAIAGLAITVGKHLLEPMLSAAKLLTTVTAKVNNFTQTFPSFTRYAVIGGMALGALAVIGGGVAVVLSGLTTAFGVLRAAIIAATVAKKLFSAAFWMSPIGIATGLIGGLIVAVGALAYKFDGVGKAIAGAFGWLGKFLGVSAEVENQGDELGEAGQSLPKKIDKSASGVNSGTKVNPLDGLVPKASGGSSKAMPSTLNPVGGAKQFVDSRKMDIVQNVSIEGSSLNPEQLKQALAENSSNLAAEIEANYRASYLTGG